MKYAKIIGRPVTRRAQTHTTHKKLHALCRWSVLSWFFAPFSVSSNCRLIFTGTVGWLTERRFVWLTFALWAPKSRLSLLFTLILSSSLSVLRFSTNVMCNVFFVRFLDWCWSCCRQCCFCIQWMIYFRIVLQISVHLSAFNAI